MNDQFFLHASMSHPGNWKWNLKKTCLSKEDRSLQDLVLWIFYLFFFWRPEVLPLQILGQLIGNFLETCTSLLSNTVQAVCASAPLASPLSLFFPICLGFFFQTCCCPLNPILQKIVFSQTAAVKLLTHYYLNSLSGAVMALYSPIGSILVLALPSLLEKKWVVFLRC